MAKTMTRVIFAQAAVFAAGCFAMPCRAEVELLSPANGEVVALVPEAQKKVMALHTPEERFRLFADDKAHGKVLRHDKFWRKSKPLVLKWCANDGENGPWKIEIGKAPDLSDARIWYFSEAKKDKTTGREVGRPNEGTNYVDVSYTVPMANLEIAREYYWRVTFRGRCGFHCRLNHGCKASRRVVPSPIGSFRTEDVAPRWIGIEGSVGNIRDLGGRLAMNGRRVRQAMAYRGQGLNNNSVTCEKPGRNRLTMEDAKYLTGTLGIRTDLDLRGEGETAGMDESPMGPDVKLVKHPSYSYKDIFLGKGKKAMAENFRLFCDRKNYPIYFHCIGGADRTGALAYVLNGVLGVSRQGLETDWESTFYPYIPGGGEKEGGNHVWNSEWHFNEGFGKYGDANSTWNERIELYLLDCGITHEEIERFRSIMLEP